MTFVGISLLVESRSENIMKFIDDEKVNLLLKEPVVLAAIMIPILVLVGGSIFKDRTTKKRVVNPNISKDKEKVVDKVDCGEIEKIAEYKDGKLVMCRCWRSKTFPYCDGAHNQHNKETGDNVGPLIVIHPVGKKGN